MTPSKIHLHKKTQTLDICYDNENFSLSAEFLRVHSPSAEVKGHAGHGGETPYGKRGVRIEKLEMTGNYAIQIFFDDGHSSGLYSWKYLHELCTNQQALWQGYLDKLHVMQKSRDKDTSVVTLFPAS
ncbi:MAG TPA: DUF971 domain-containing protein [Marinagarivorans sp.]